MPWEYTLYVPRDPRAIGIGRRTLRDILTAHHLPALVEPAELLASELLTNALRHTRGPAALKLRRAGRSFRLGAWDTDPAPPVTGRPRDPDDESGRGLPLVEACADDWGWFRIDADGSGGKYVWCELETGRPA
jgi:anti-sigma regulatory factor (Ser/Thr protein kinase)